MNLGGFGLLIRIISGLYGLSPYIHDFLLENTSQEEHPQTSGGIKVVQSHTRRAEKRKPAIYLILCKIGLRLL